MDRVRDYVDKVLSYVPAEEKTHERLREDLTAHISEATRDGDFHETVERMGNPKDMAKDIIDSLYREKSEVVRELVNAKAEICEQRRRMRYEYKSRLYICGLPLIHVNMSNNFSVDKGVAKGIIAIGNVSFGLLSIGGLAFGGLCFGGVCAGLISFGGLALAVLAAWGGAAVGAFAIGGVAVGMYAFGGCAIASRIAVGGYASATAAIGGVAKGLYAISTGGSSLNASMVAASEARELILAAYPNTPGFILRILTGLFS